MSSAQVNRTAETPDATVRTVFQSVHSPRKRAHKAAASGVPSGTAAKALFNGTLRSIVTPMQPAM